MTNKLGSKPEERRMPSWNNFFTFPGNSSKVCSEPQFHNFLIKDSVTTVFVDQLESNLRRKLCTVVLQYGIVLFGCIWKGMNLELLFVHDTFNY